MYCNKLAILPSNDFHYSKGVNIKVYYCASDDLRQPVLRPHLWRFCFHFIIFLQRFNALAQATLPFLCSACVVITLFLVSTALYAQYTAEAGVVAVERITAPKKTAADNV